MTNTRDEEVIRLIGSTTGMNYSDEQLKILRNHGGMCILASAGSGKTSVLTHLIAKRILTGEIQDPTKLLCTTFSRGGAQEMDIRANNLLSKLGIKANIQFRTMHSTYLKLLRDLGYSIKVIDQSTKMQYIREACKDQKITLEDEEYTTLESLLSYQINNLLSDEDLFKSYVYTLREQIPLEKYSNIRQLFNNKKSENGYLDFDDMQLTTFTIFRNPAYTEPLKQYCHSLYEHIYIDEAQDISKIQFEILKYLVSSQDRLVLIGDDDQCIYEWRGADPSIILNVCGYDTDLNLMNLTTNYRCNKLIVEKADTGIHFNRTRSQKTMLAHTEEPGEIKICNINNGNLYEMSKYAYKYIRELIIDKGVKPSDIAVLSRNNSHLTILNNMLFRDGIFSKSADDMRYTFGFMYKTVKSLIQLGENTLNSSVVGENLWKCCPYLRMVDSRAIGRLQESYGCKFSDTLGILLTTSSRPTSIIWDNPGYNLKAFDYAKYGDLMGKMSGDIFNNLEEIYYLLTTETAESAIIGLLYMFLDYKNGSWFKSEDTKRFAEGYIDYTVDLIKRNGITEFNRYLKSVEQYEMAGMAVISPLVTLSTIHGAKGKEWKYVILFADDNVAFPSFSGIGNCIEDGVPDSDINKMIDEGRRLHYVAMTRAKEHLIIFANKSNLSVYTMEALGFLNTNNNNFEIIDMAQSGLRSELIHQVENTIFNKNSTYYLDINPR